MYSQGNIKFKTYQASNMSSELIHDCSVLYSENYGTYSADAILHGKKPGNRVKMSDNFIRCNYCEIPECQVVCAYQNSLLVGQAFYIRKNYPHIGTMTWVLQLVVKKEFQHQKIGQRLLHSIWGFSNDIAWGLATANPYTVRTLEAATFRRVSPKAISNHLNQIKIIANDIWFARNAKITVNEHQSLINTDFPIDTSNNIISQPWLLGDLLPQHEWLAFTFKAQDVDPSLFKRNYPGLMSFSEDRLKDAYGRMRMPAQSWTKGTKSEVDYIIEHCKLPSHADVLDIGCGTGRHSIEFARRGYSVCGIDFSSQILDIAHSNANRDNLPVQFINQDCRCVDFFKSTRIFESFDLVLCLYDVVGSFPSVEDNTLIIRNAYRALRPTGHLVLSVMNYELTSSRAKYKSISLESNPKLLLNLKPSNIMQQSGNIFNPDYYVIDTATHTVYRKEQFVDDGELPAEYVIRDVRYNRDEIVSMLQEEHFEIIESHFVSAGKWNFPIAKGTKDGAKEILVICKKDCSSSKASSFLRRIFL